MSEVGFTLLEDLNYSFFQVGCQKILSMRKIFEFTREPLIEAAERFCLSERTVRRYIDRFYSNDSVHGPRKLLGDHEQLILLQLILSRPGVYLHELQTELLNKFGVTVSAPTICRTLKFMGCTRQSMHHVAIQRSDMLRAKFMAEISAYDLSDFPSLIIVC